MTATIAAFLLAAFVKVSPYVLQQLKPILATAEGSIWKAAYPLAVAIVADLAKGNLQGLDKHKAAVLQLEQAMVAAGHIALGQVAHVHWGQIILAAYANSPESGLVPIPAVPATPPPPQTAGR